MFAILLCLLSSPFTSAQEGVRDFSTMSSREAYYLNGRASTFKVIVESCEWEHEGVRWHDVESRNDVMRVVRFAKPGQAEQGDTVTVRGRLEVIAHPPSIGEMGTIFPGFIEYRLADCRLVE